MQIGDFCAGDCPIKTLKRRKSSLRRKKNRSKVVASIAFKMTGQGKVELFKLNARCGYEEQVYSTEVMYRC